MKYLEDKIEELKKLKGLPKANRSDINAKIKKHEEEIFGLTHI